MNYLLCMHYVLLLPIKNNLNVANWWKFKQSVLIFVCYKLVISLDGSFDNQAVNWFINVDRDYILHITHFMHRRWQLDLKVGMSFRQVIIQVLYLCTTKCLCLPFCVDNHFFFPILD